MVILRATVPVIAPAATAAFSTTRLRFFIRSQEVLLDKAGACADEGGIYARMVTERQLGVLARSLVERGEDASSILRFLRFLVETPRLTLADVDGLAEIAVPHVPHLPIPIASLLETTLNAVLEERIDGGLLRGDVLHMHFDQALRKRYS